MNPSEDQICPTINKWIKEFGLSFVISEFKQCIPNSSFSDEMYKLFEVADTLAYAAQKEDARRREGRS